MTDKPTNADGSELIAAERRRQIEKEKWTPDHDDEHDAGELSAAGAAYALNASGMLMTNADKHWHQKAMELAITIWPWAVEWWKPKDPIRDLARAGALMAAEIDKMLAAAPRQPEAQPAEDEAVKELLAAAIAFREYADRSYNLDPKFCAALNCGEQQRLWRAIDAALSKGAK